MPNSGSSSYTRASVYNGTCLNISFLCCFVLVYGRHIVCREMYPVENGTTHVHNSERRGKVNQWQRFWRPISYMQHNGKLYTVSPKRINILVLVCHTKSTSTFEYFCCINKILYVGTTHSNLLVQRVWDYYYKCRGFFYFGGSYIWGSLNPTCLCVVLSRLMIFFCVYKATAAL